MRSSGNQQEKRQNRDLKEREQAPKASKSEPKGAKSTYILKKFPQKHFFIMYIVKMLYICIINHNLKSNRMKIYTATADKVAILKAVKMLKKYTDEQPQIRIKALYNIVGGIYYQFLEDLTSLQLDGIVIIENQFVRLGAPAKIVRSEHGRGKWINGGGAVPVSCRLVEAAKGMITAARNQQINAEDINTYGINLERFSEGEKLTIKNIFVTYSNQVLSGESFNFFLDSMETAAVVFDYLASLDGGKCSVYNELAKIYEQSIYNLSK